MNLPFTSAQFWSVFETYNATVWPAQVLLSIAGVTAVAGALFKPDKPRVSFGITALLWVWSAVAYHASFWARVTPAGYIFAAFFLAQAILLLWAIRDVTAFVAPSPAEVALGATLFIYALVVYPLIVSASGHYFPSMPTFGVPCPTTIFTFGLLCVFASSIPMRLLAIPVMWTVIATSAAARLDVIADYGMAIAATAAIAAWLAAHPNMLFMKRGETS